MNPFLHCDQARDHHIIINDLATCFYDSYGNLGRQNIELGGQMVALRHDSLKYYLNIREPTPQEWDHCQIWELTSPNPWVGKNRIRRRRNNMEPEWSKHLVFLNHEVTKHTLLATTQLVNTVEVETYITPHLHFK